MLKAFIFILLLYPVSLFAQTSIIGKVIDKDSHNPIPDASVFLSNASVGGKTGDDGGFTLSNVRNGQYDLIVTCVGYEPFHETIMVNGDNLDMKQIALPPKITTLNEVVIKPNQQKLFLEIFAKKFMGETDNARQCKIVNPEVINFESIDDNGLKASTDEFLIVDNMALGYRVKILLKEFVYTPKRGNTYFAGPMVYEPMTGTPSQQKAWNKRRMKAYKGSVMHFLRACITGTVDKEGFNVMYKKEKFNPQTSSESLIKEKIQLFSAKNTANKDSLSYWLEQQRSVYSITMESPDVSEYFKTTDTPNVYALVFPDYEHVLLHSFQIRYESGNLSILTFLKPVFYFDNNGSFMDAHNQTLQLYWGTQRMGDKLPVDFDP